MKGMKETISKLQAPCLSCGGLCYIYVERRLVRLRVRGREVFWKGQSVSKNPYKIKYFMQIVRALSFGPMLSVTPSVP